MRYRIPIERVAHETLDGEVVILDHANGVYFSLTGAGAEVWALLVAGLSLDDLVAHVATGFEGHDGAAEQAVRELVAELSSEALIEARGAGEDSGAAVTAAWLEGAPRAWVAPKLERFTDLQSLLLLDPIHDVDEGGWPHQTP